MNTRRFGISLLLVAASVTGVVVLPVRAGSGVPAVGDEAPVFELQGSDGETYSLTDYRGEKVVVLAWFPKAFTGG